jgi:hypothetical protein
MNNSLYVLSTEENTLNFPKIIADNSVILDPQYAFNILLKSYLPETNEVEFFSQFIKLHDPVLDACENNYINCVYGFIINHTQKLNNCFWHTFKLGTDNKYHDLLLEAVQKLK